jgi:hypothetical protein
MKAESEDGKERLQQQPMGVFQGIILKQVTNKARLGLIFFALAFLGALLNLPCVLKLQAESLSIKIAWRYFGLLLFIMPQALLDLLSLTTIIKQTIIRQLPLILLLSAANTMGVYLVYYAAEHTFVAHTLLLCSLATTFSSTWKIICGLPYTRIEYVGIGLNVLGSYLCCCEGGPLSRILFSTRS